MTRKRNGNYAFWLTVTVVLTVGTFALSSVSKVPDIFPKWNHFDWFLHVVEYGILGLCVHRFLIASPLAVSDGGSMFSLAVFYCAVIGGLNELWQKTIPHRTASWGDEIANVVGAVVLVGIAQMLRPGERNREGEAAPKSKRRR